MTLTVLINTNKKIFLGLHESDGYMLNVQCWNPIGDLVWNWHLNMIFTSQTCE